MNKHKIKTQKKYYGFTLVELIIVITILTILATIAFVSFNSYVKDSRDSKRLADINQIKKGVEIYKESFSKTPIPDKAKSFTGGKNTLFVGKINNKVLANLSKDTFDPLSKQEYIYATFGTGEYFQVGTFSENDLSYNLIDKTYADYKTAIVDGNYLFDPSLPSLLISSGTTLYDKNNCFIINGLGVNCVKKDDLILNNYDKSLVGYWDMETLTPDNKLKDLSGNNNHGTFGGSMTYSNSLTGGLIGKGMEFKNDSVIKNYITTNLSGETYLKENFTIGLIVERYSSRNEILLEINSNSGISLQSNSKYDLNSYKMNIGGFTQNKDIVSTPINNSKIYLVVTFDGNKGRFFINGIESTKRGNFLGPAIFNNKNLIIGGRIGANAGFNGLIDDIKIYNRVLSDEEIKQQSKILGL